jgi:hypothetical protein
VKRILAAARLNVVDPGPMIGGPWLFAVPVFAFYLAVWGFTDIESRDPGEVTNGVVLFHLVVLTVFAQAITQTLPYAMSLGMSRRTFYRGTALVAVLIGLVFGVALSALAAVEGATGGWGLGLHYWVPEPLDVDNTLAQVAVSAATVAAAAFLGTAAGSTHARWRTPGVVAVLAALLVTALAVTALAPMLSGLGTLLGRLADLPTVVLCVGLSAAIALGSAGYASMVLRRMVP